jgi:hypothetical protein
MSSLPHQSLVHLYEPALPEALFRKLKARVLALGSERIRTTYQTTFWYPLTGPTNVAEQAVEALRPTVPQEGIVGVEWWLSRMRTTDVRVDFHQDRDEVLANRSGALRHPRISSVLFLNRVRRGGLLCVTEEPPNEDNPSCAPGGRDWDLVAPRPNRFLWFAGNLTHGVLDARGEIPTARLPGEGEWRFTLIANWWDRRPTSVPTFQESRAYRSLAVER